MCSSDLSASGPSSSRAGAASSRSWREAITSNSGLNRGAVPLAAPSPSRQATTSAMRISAAEIGAEPSHAEARLEAARQAILEGTTLQQLLEERDLRQHSQVMYFI